MGRPEPCVLFAQSFVHPQLDEYVDEVRFTEPVVISACEFLEQNSSASCPMISLSGASCPQSFALEVFVQCEGEARFRRLCQAFLYSPSSSNILEVQPVVTNHLVIRGSYRTLTIVVYGNTAEELGQFSVEFDLDNSLASLVRSPAEGKIEDLPLALQPTKPTFEESILSVQHLHLIVESPPLPEVNQILQLGIKIGQVPGDESSAQSLTKSLLLAASSYVLHDFSANAGNLVEAKNELVELYKRLCSKKDGLHGKVEQFEIDDLVQPITDDLVLDIFHQWFDVNKNVVIDGISVNSQLGKLTEGLSVVRLLCTDVEGCHQFVKAGGMQHLINVLCHDLGTTGTTLLALGVVECACRYAVGCEAFLGWLQDSACVLASTSEGYSTLLRLLLERPQHNIAVLVTRILHRLRAYEIISKFESRVGSLLQNVSAGRKVPYSGIKSLVEANSEMKCLLKLLDFREPIEDPSPVAHAKRLLLFDEDDGTLPYKATVGLIGYSTCCISHVEIDPYLLSLLKERCFLGLLAALISSPSLRLATGSTMDVFIDLVTTIEAIVLSLLLCRSGLLFFLSEPEATTTLIVALRGVEDIHREEFLSLRYAAVLISRGFFCPPQDIGMIVETNLRVVSAIDRLIGSALHSEELLWALWDLCSISRSDIGRQAVLSIRFFPEAISILMTAVQSGKELEPLNSNSGASPLSLAIFHASAEVFEVMVNDSTACTLSAWIPQAVDLHKALHSSSPGSSKKDAPTRLLERVDAAVVYHKKGAIGVLRYAAVLASGGDAQLTSTSFLVSDPMDIDNIASDSTGTIDFRSVESILGKLVADKFFDGIILRDSSVPQLMTAMRILAFISEQAGVAATLYEEGAVTVVYVILMNCALMLERASNTYDYLVDEGAEYNSTADLLLERSQEHHLVEMLLPSLVLLLTLLRKLQEAAEQHHNTKLLNALLRLHREISPKLAACTTVLPFNFASSTLVLGGVCHLLASCIACWPIFGWTPGLFPRILENVPAPASLALGPKEACSVLCLLGEFFPEEGIWLWKNGTSCLNALKTIGVGTLLGVRCIQDIDWFLQPRQFEKMLSRLLPHLDKIGQIVMHFSCTDLIVLQDMLRVLVIRMSCQKRDYGAVLLRPLLSWMQDHLYNGVAVSEIDTFKGERMLEFLAGLLEHPVTKKILMNEGLVDILTRMLYKMMSMLDQNSATENKTSANNESSLQMQWCFPIFRSFSFICDPGVSVCATKGISRCLVDCPDFEGHCTIISCLLKFCLVVQVGKELRSCWNTLTTLSRHNIGRSAFAFIATQMRSSSTLCRDTSKESQNMFSSTGSEESDHEAAFPFLACWQKLLAVMEKDDGISRDAIEITTCFAIGILHLCAAGKSVQGLVASRSLFGLESGSAECQNKENLKHVFCMIDHLNLKISTVSENISMHMQTTLEKARAAVKAMLGLLEKSLSIIHLPDIVPEKELPSSEVSVSSWDLPPHLSVKSEVLLQCIGNGSAMPQEDFEESQMGIQRTDESYLLGGLTDRFMWECLDSSADRPTMQVPSLKRKAASVDGSNRRQRGDGVVSGGGAETTASSSFVRTGGATVSSSGPTRRDTFRQRKPNTSRPPSMHVDDYVARERNNDGMSSSSNVATVPRAGSTGGRPPSIHVDEFMARQRERQQSVALTSGDLQQPVQTLPAETESTGDKVSKSRQMKTQLEDDLQEINIELDVVSESEDMLQFPQADDFLPSAPVSMPGANSPDSFAEDAEFNTCTAPQFVQNSKETPLNAVEGVNAGNVRQAEAGILRHGNLTPDNGQGKHYGGGETPFYQEQYDNRMPSPMPISSKGYEALSTSKPPEMMPQFYDQRSISGIQMAAGQGSMPMLAIHHRSGQSQPGPGPMINMSQAHFDQSGLAQAPPLPPLPPPPVVTSGSTPQMVESSSAHASSYMHSTRDVQPPLPSGSPFQAFDPAKSGAVPSQFGRDNKPSPNDYYKDSVGSSMNGAVALPLPPGSYASLEVPLHAPPPLQFNADHSRPTSYGLVALATPPCPYDAISGISTSTTPWVGVALSSRISDDNIPSGRLPPPLPPMPPPFSAPPIPQASSVQPASGIYNQTNPASPLPPVTSLSDKIFGSFSASITGQTSAAQSHPLRPAFVPPLPPGRPTSLTGNIPSSVPPQQQGQNHQPHMHLVQQHLLSQPPQPPLQPRQPLQPPQPPLPPPPQPPQQPRPPLQPHQSSEQRPQIQTQSSVAQPHIQFQPQPPPLQQNHPTQPVQQHPQLHQQQAQQPFFSHQQQEQQHEQREQVIAQYNHQQSEHNQQQESTLSLQQYFSSPEAIQALLGDQEKLRRLLEQHPKLMQMLQERLNQS